MSCEPLPNTGLDGPVLLVLTVATALLLVGLWSLLHGRRSRGAGAATLLLVILAIGGGITIGLVPASPAQAAPVDCPSPGPNQTNQPTQSAELSQSLEPTQTATESATESPTPPPADNSLTITQTSVMDNLAPGVEPAEIAGLVVNNGPDSTFITAITVEITAVTKRAGAVDGTCDASDYVLLDTRMPVGRTLAANGGSTDFSGAVIGFNNKSSNQDACQGATIALRYRAISA